MSLQPKTIDVIELKFNWSLKAHKKDHKSDLKELFNRYGIPFNTNTVTAYLIGVLRAISYDSKIFVQSVTLRWKEFEKIVDISINKIFEVANDIAKE